MTITITETYPSGRSASGDDRTIVLSYFMTGEDDIATVLSDLENEAPAEYGGLARDHVEAEYYAGNKGDITWIGHAIYKIKPLTAMAVGDSSYAFDTGCGVEHITHSIATSATFVPPGGVAANFNKAINVADGRIGGVDIVVPGFNWQETHYFADNLIDGAYLAVLFGLTGKTNDAVFFNRKDSDTTFAIGEVLFLGASGGKRDQGDWEVTYSFSASPNRTGISVGAIVNIAKKGWEYFWVRVSPNKDAAGNIMVPKPIQANVEQVYYAGDFATLGIR